MEDLEKAKLLLYQYLQREAFVDKCNQLRIKQQVDYQDKLQRFSPFLARALFAREDDFENIIHRTQKKHLDEVKSKRKGTHCAHDDREHSLPLYSSGH